MQDHQVAQTSSSLHIRAVLDDESKMTSSNMIHVEKGAQNVKAQQSCKSILLSKQAHAIALPQLEIKAHNVACKHGAAISSFNQEQQFYLQSRGLDKESTKRMLIDGFLKESKG
jgi:Fe-S cluster assembly protein SufD